MNNDLQSRISRQVVKELVGKQLKEYLENKGFKETMEALIYPPQLADLDRSIPHLVNKVEIIPYTEELDPTTGVVKIGWNLFVLGHNRMFLGHTTHTRLIELKQAIITGKDHDGNTSSPIRTAQEVYDFIMEKLSNSARGLEPLPKNVQMPNKSPIVPTNRPKIGPSMSGGYYEKNRPV